MDIKEEEENVENDNTVRKRLELENTRLINYTVVRLSFGRWRWVGFGVREEKRWSYSEFGMEEHANQVLEEM